MKLGMAICLTLGMSFSPLAAQQTLLASGATGPAVFIPNPAGDVSWLRPTAFSAELAESMAGLSPSTTLYDMTLRGPSNAACTVAIAPTLAAVSSNYAFDHEQFTAAAIKASFTHDNMVAMARNFVPGQPLPDAPDYRPLTTKQKFDAFLRNTHSAGQVVSILSDAAISQATGAYPRLNPGMPGFGERLGISAMGAEAASFIGGFVYPTLFHQDPRYFPSHQHRVLNRLAYAASRAFIGRSDNGTTVINTSVIASQFTEAAISNAYVPYRNESVSGTIENALTGLGGVAEGHILDEFWPDIKEFVWRHTHSGFVQHAMDIGDPTHQQVYRDIGSGQQSAVSNQP
jgi:hypothetical protein